MRPMISYIFCCVLMFCFVSCASHVEIQKSEEEFLQPRADHRLSAEEESQKIEQAKNTPSGSPVGAAVQTMKKAESEMLATLELLQQLKTGDQVLDCRNDLQNSLQKIQTFFKPDPIVCDDVSFWFFTDKGRVGIFEEDGALFSCTIGLFMNLKQLTAVQYRGDTVVETEFYVDSQKKELMIHRYVDRTLMQNENYTLAKD
ncbi:MAG: hypothetical protein KBC30_03375 [Planctomycetes bacterium]|nr:hypothetical protein [Planctomycetota bacterium]HNZ66675.1 hypothetical protein [Planctomycetota bacterium]HPY73906.1 hypothetical protein [Planctomycetota bacterium]HQA99529.1 hypothetical protein [Planctomycetota bacterium]HRU51191.1 hypothetical protein [Planctomycetota bacterium]